MLRDRYAPEDVFARVPELAAQTDPVLAQLDRVLEDEPLFAAVKGDLARRYPKTTSRGRHSTPVEVILRLLIVQHLFDWSYREVERRVADSLVLRQFCRVYFERVPDSTTLLRWAATIQPATLAVLLDRVVVLARQAQVTKGRKLRLDGTVVPAAIHHPTDSGLLADGVRVLSRVLRRSKALVGEQLAGVRDAFRTRTRTMLRGLQQLHRLGRRQGEAVAEERASIYTKLVGTAERTVRQAERVREALGRVGEEASRRAGRLAEQLDTFLPRVHRVIDQARRRVLRGEQVPAGEKLVSLFEPDARVITRHKAGAAVEFGRTVMVDEVEGGIVTRVAILADGATEHEQLAPALDHHRAVFGQAPDLVAGDRGVHSPENERLAREAGVKHLAIPRGGKATPEQRERERDRTWRRRYRWRAGIEGRIHSLRRDYGLDRCAYRGPAGLARCVGWGAIASDLRRIGLHLAA